MCLLVRVCLHMNLQGRLDLFLRKKFQDLDEKA